MYCKKCGKKCKKGDRICPDCGYELTPGAGIKRHYGVIIILCIVCLLVVFFVRRKDKTHLEESDKDKQTENMSGENKDLLAPDNEVDSESEYMDKDHDLDEYFKMNSTVLSRWDARNSETLKNETDVDYFLEQRGFTQNPITYDYSNEGTYISSQTISIGSKDKHPIYQTYYVNSHDELWVIYIIDDSIVAYPTSFNLQSDQEVQRIISEHEEIISYDSENNEFYKTIPDPSVLSVIVVDQIDSSCLDQLTMEELN